MRSRIKQIIQEELSGDNAKLYVQQITNFHRIQASTMFHEAAEHVKDTLLKAGLEDVQIEQFVSDGWKKYWTHTSPVGWEVKSAELRLIKPEEKLICRYADTPTCLHTHSKSTPREGVTAELVDVGAGLKAEDYEGKDVKGKLVLATGRAKLVHEQAVYKRGAAGVITDTLTHEMKNVRESVDLPDAHAYQAIWPGKEEIEKVTFGFSLSKRQGNHLRGLLREGKAVKLKANVDARLFAGNLDVVVATIPGSSKADEEVFLTAHLCHPKPSANDNASGSGLLIEIARTMQALIGSGMVERPARTLRFMWVPETYGTIAYLYSHPELPRRLVAGINLDMVGQDQEVCRSTLTLDRTPDSLPSYLNDLMMGLVEESVDRFDPATMFGSSSTFRFKANVYSGGSDHAELVNSSFKVPCVMLLQWPDLFYHSSMDTIDKVSPDMLERVGWIATVAALTLADADVDDTLYLACQTSSRGIERIKGAGRKAVEELYRIKEDSETDEERGNLAKSLSTRGLYHRSRIEHVISREKEAVSSVKRLSRDDDLNNFVHTLVEDISVAGEREIERFNEVLVQIAEKIGVPTVDQVGESEADKRSRKMVPEKLFKGSLSMEAFRKALAEKEWKWYQEKRKEDRRFGVKMVEVLNFMDGKKTVHDIVTAVSAEYTETKTEDVLNFLQDLEKMKLISLNA